MCVSFCDSLVIHSVQLKSGEIRTDNIYYNYIYCVKKTREYFIKNFIKR